MSLSLVRYLAPAPTQRAVRTRELLAIYTQSSLPRGWIPQLAFVIGIAIQIGLLEIFWLLRLEHIGISASSLLLLGAIVTALYCSELPSLVAAGVGLIALEWSVPGSILLAFPNRQGVGWVLGLTLVVFVSRHGRILRMALRQQQLQEYRTQRLVGRLANMLREPTNALIGQLGMLRARAVSLPIPLLEQVNHLQQVGTRLVDLCEDLRQASQIGEGVQLHTCYPQDLAPLAHRAAERVRLEFAGRSVLYPSGPVGRASVDGLAVMSAVEECVRNALTFTSGRVVVEVGEHLIAVRDEGPGLRPDAFEPFSSSAALQLGLGLPRVQAIMAAHGGRVLARFENGWHRVELHFA